MMFNCELYIEFLLHLIFISIDHKSSLYLGVMYMLMLHASLYKLDFNVLITFLAVAFSCSGDCSP